MEEYKIINNYPNYEVSNFGNVRNITTGKQKTPRISRSGYYDVSLYKNNKEKHGFIHKLVADAFLKNLNEKPCVDHIDGNRLNNTLVNLRFVTYSENNMNKLIYSNNKSGTTGVYWRSTRNTWVARIEIDKKMKYLGCFTNKENAIKARKDAQDLYFGEYQKFNSNYERLQFEYNQLMKKYDDLLIEIQNMKTLIK